MLNGCLAKFAQTLRNRSLQLNVRAIEKPERVLRKRREDVYGSLEGGLIT